MISVRGGTLAITPNDQTFTRNLYLVNNPRLKPNELDRNRYSTAAELPNSPWAHSFLPEVRLPVRRVAKPFPTIPPRAVWLLGLITA